MSRRQSHKVPRSPGRRPPLGEQSELSARQAKRAAKAAERSEKSEALREEGNAFFHKGDYQNAVDRYRQAVRVHGPSAKPVLLTNLAAAYHHLGKFHEAHEAADSALAADPKSVKARYRRAMARKSMEMWNAAAIDFRIVLRLDPRYEEEVQKELASVEEYRTFEDEHGCDNDSEDEAPAPDDDPELGESLSESSDCEHVGNGRPCKFYNHAGCAKGSACPFSHAPDFQSERDALGRNVCRYYLMDLCRFGERCSYSHSKDHLSQKGWWSTAKGVNNAKGIYKVQQTFKKAAIDYEEQTGISNPETAPPPPPPPKENKRARGKKRRITRASPDLGRSGSTVAVTLGRDQTVPAVSVESARRTSGNGSTESASESRSGPEEYEYGSDDDGYEEYGMFGFTKSEVEELLCHGVKPWDDDASDFLQALHDAYRKIDALDMFGQD